MTKIGVILANGTYPQHDIPLNLLHRASLVVCCDGAANEFIQKGGIPNFIIGDGDSLDPEYKEDYKDRVIIVNDQETNDQTKAVNFLVDKGINNIIILGATGKREDHTLGNISLLIEYFKKGINVETITDSGIFFPRKGTSFFDSTPKQQVSIFNFGATDLKAKGLVYPLHDFTNWWEGTLNETIGTNFTINAEGYYIVFLEHSKD